MRGAKIKEYFDVESDNNGINLWPDVGVGPRDITPPSPITHALRGTVNHGVGGHLSLGRATAESGPLYIGTAMQTMGMPS